MPKLGIIVPPHQALEPIDSGEAAASLIDGVLGDGRSLLSRPGLFLYKTVSSPPSVCQGLFWWKYKGLLLIVYGGNLFASACTSVPITFTQVNTAAPLGTGRCTFAANRHWVYVASGGKIVRWNGVLTTPAEYDPLAAAIGLVLCSHVAYIDGYVVGNKAGSQSWYYAEPGALDTDPLVWAATGLVAEGSPDDIKIIASAWREVLIVGSDASEIWYDSGDATVPFQRLEGAFIEQGTLSPRSLVPADNTWIWLNQYKQVIRLQGRSPTILSLAIRKELEQLRVVSDAVGFILFDYYVLSFPTENVAWVYDLVKGCWYKWGKWNQSDFAYDKYLGGDAVWASTLGLWFVGGDNGKIYLAERSLRNDAGALVRTEYVSKLIDHGTHEDKFCDSVTLRLKRGSDGALGSFQRFVASMDAGIEIAFPGATYYQFENIHILGGSDWTYALSPLPTGLSFNATTRELSGTVTSSTAVSSVLTLTNVSSGLVLEVPLTLSPGVVPSSVTTPDERKIEFYLQDDGRSWSNAISVNAGALGESSSDIKFSQMGSYASRRYKIVFPSRVDVAVADFSEEVALEDEP